MSGAAVARGLAANLAGTASTLGTPIPLWLHNDDGLSLLSLLAVAAASALLYRGLELGAKVTTAVCALNLALLALLIVVGSTNISPSNYTPFAPFGLGGTLRGAGTVFFAYVGFDAVCTLAAEMRTPSTTLPRAILGTVAVTTSLYVAVSIVITGMVPYDEIDVAAPLSDAFLRFPSSAWASYLVSVGTITVLVVTVICSLLAQPRILVQMALDGLLPPAFAVVDEHTGVPKVGTVVTAVSAGSIAFAVDLAGLSDTIAIGTLCAFASVCVGLVVLRARHARTQPGGSAAAEARLLRLLAGAVSSLSCLALALVCLPASTATTIFVILASLASATTIVALTLRLPRGAVAVAGDALAPFRVPGVPLLPLAGYFVNLCLCLSLSVSAWIRLLVWMAFGVAIFWYYRRKRIAQTTGAGREDGAAVEGVVQGEANDDAVSLVAHVDEA